MFRFKFCLALCALNFVFSARAQHFEIRNYSVKEGVGQSQVYTLCQDKRGFVWMGTRGGGVTGFDGMEFRQLTTRNGLSDNYISSIKTDAAGNLWIASNAGISMYNGRVFKNYYIHSGTNKIEVSDFVIAGNGVVYVASESGLYSLVKSTFTRLTDSGKVLSSVVTDKSGYVWYGTARGVKRYDPVKKKTTSYLTNRYINKVYSDASGKIWVGTYGNGIYLGDQNGFRPFTANGEIKASEIYEIYQDPKGNFWFGTLSSGIYKYEPLGKNVVHISEKDGLSNNHVRSIICDREGNYWFGTSGGGVCHYFGLPFSHYDRRSGLKETYIYSVFSDSRNRLWVGTGNSGVAVLDSGQFRNFGADSGFSDSKIRAFAEDSSGDIWLGSEGDGLWRYNGKYFESIRPLENKFIRCMLVADNTIWVSAAGLGIYSINRGEANAGNLIVRNYNKQHGLLENRVSAIISLNNGDIAYGTENSGIGFLSSGKPVPKVITTVHGLPSEKIRCLVADTFGYLWAGTAGGGIARIRLADGTPVIESKSFNKKLRSLNIYLMVFDKKGNLFIGTESGLDYITLDKNRNLISVRHFGKNEGFVGIETCQNAVAADSEGYLWFGTINGLTQCNPGAITRNLVPPSVGITGIKLFYKDIMQTEYSKFAGNWFEFTDLDLPYDQNHLTFDLRGIHFGNPDQVAFRWMLKGSDEEWSPESQQRSVTYSNIPPGEYTFLVMGRNADGIWTQEPVKISFRIHPPYWQTWWFRTLIILLLAGSLSLLFRLRLKSLNRRTQKAAEKLQMEKKLADLEHQALRLQMNPHFIFNALNSIQAQIGENNQQAARYNLAKFGRLMRQILDLSQKPFITLKEEIDSLENYLLVEKFSSGDNFDYHISISPEMDTDFIKIPPMLLQPFAENAIKHGFKNLKERRGHIEIDFRENDNMLFCTVTDNGVGRTLAAERSSSEGESYHTSTALRVIRERLQLLHNQTGKEPVFKITDLYDDNGKSAGTRVEVGIPLL